MSWCAASLLVSCWDHLWALGTTNVISCYCCRKAWPILLHHHCFTSFLRKDWLWEGSHLRRRLPNAANCFAVATSVLEPQLWIEEEPLHRQPRCLRIHWHHQTGEMLMLMMSKASLKEKACLLIRRVRSSKNERRRCLQVCHSFLRSHLRTTGYCFSQSTRYDDVGLRIFAADYSWPLKTPVISTLQYLNLVKRLMTVVLPGT